MTFFAMLMDTAKPMPIFQTPGDMLVELRGS
jgi:hypothetical protein